LVGSGAVSGDAGVVEDEQATRRSNSPASKTVIILVIRILSPAHLSTVEGDMGNAALFFVDNDLKSTHLLYLPHPLTPSPIKERGKFL
jgi:hypothetical protein